MTDEELKQEMDDRQPGFNLVKRLEEELKRNFILRDELRREFKLRETAEFSRDTVRAHAQAALNKYRAQDDIFEELEKLLVDRTRSGYLAGSDYHRGFTEAVEMLVNKRAAYKATK